MHACSGYMAPEYAFQGHFSVKSDVFGFGVLAMEIVSGQKNGSFRDERENVEHLISYAWRNWEVGRAENVLDSAIHGGCSCDEMLRCVHIALLCVQENPVDRPTMAAVVHLLGSSDPITAVPSKPGFFLQGRLDGVSSMAITSPHQPTVSRNSASITDLYPRWIWVSEWASERACVRAKYSCFLVGKSLFKKRTRGATREWIYGKLMWRNTKYSCNNYIYIYIYKSCFSI